MDYNYIIQILYTIRIHLHTHTLTYTPTNTSTPTHTSYSTEIFKIFSLLTERKG